MTMKTSTGIKRGKRATNRNRLKAVSAAAMGTALAAILATSTAFQSSPTSAIAGIGNGLLHTRDQHSTMALHYRYGSTEDDQPTLQPEKNSRVDKSGDRQSFSRRIVSLSQLTFMRPVDDQQSVMDDYLEYVDRRYSRIHQQAARSPSRRPRVILDFQLPRKIFFSTLALHQRVQEEVPTADAASPSITAASPRALAELNALGLSDLASARLRQRLQAPRDLRDEFTAASYLFDHLPSPSIEAALLTHMQGSINRASPVPAPVKTSSSNPVSTAPAVGGRVSSFANVGPIAQFQLMFQTLQKIVQAFVTSIKIMANFASRLIPEILENGGFRHSVKMMSLATAAVLLMFKPLFRGALKG
jgi:hypothetical protein